MEKIRTAVVGVGYLGSYHAEKYSALPQSELVAVCDIHHERCYAKAKELNAEAVINYQSLIGLVDAVSIAVPTPLHHAVARFFLDNGIHVLLEKPIATTLEEADDLIAAAKRNRVILQIGHLERFNSAVKAVDPLISNPRFIESLRLAPFRLRGTDVNVVLDLMIHDIDIIQSIVKSDIQNISASGASVLSPYVDIANARIEFTNGCVANVTASRVSLKIERKLRIFQHDNYVAIDLDHKKMAIHRKGTHEMFPGIPEITRQVERFHKGDALMDQISAFLNSIIHNKPPVISGEEGKRALATALEISLIVRRTNEQFPISPIAAENVE
ncbi:Gfo/Idh/MocA family protein [Coxiella burnetii]|uniref:Gfo/Idh/MocA family protein n=1 Tax=Coxiella burnetii TaxID=777 RepID=UPI0001610290|nr:Gfo/Idh/MocA family oxidoreductase [Coxiella burnetii]ABX78604.1 oxidoreductase, NAD-binding [Coxiella burnetii RSA 331]ATN81794.1 UDP-N-acetyl-D-glucosamine dehydrogenase [Coxiella burnetii]ATN83697.1 UDP-N-acetyl-D-glucosamine dehydrogenase [Coxiella burnetii]POZ79453.1 gfo/Idh/MocA family oxidoreductase [Coxiella burnetii]